MYTNDLNIIVKKHPLLTTKFSELKVNLGFGIRLQSYTVTNRKLYSYAISAK